MVNCVILYDVYYTDSRIGGGAYITSEEGWEFETLYDAKFFVEKDIAGRWLNWKSKWVRDGDHEQLQIKSVIGKDTSIETYTIIAEFLL